MLLEGNRESDSLKAFTFHENHFPFVVGGSNHFVAGWSAVRSLGVQIRSIRFFDFKRNSLKKTSLITIKRQWNWTQQ